MTSRKRRLSFLVPLWLTAAILLITGVTAPGAQEQPDTSPPAAAVAEPAPAPGESGIPDGATIDAATGEAQAGLTTGGDVTAEQRARLAREEARGGTLAQRATSALGLLVFVFFAWAISVNRRAVNWRLVAWGLGLQFVFAVLILLTGPGQAFFATANDLFVALIGYTVEGARFIFGNLVENNVPVGPAGGSMAPVAADGTWANTGAYFAFNVLPTIIFFSSLMTLMYYFGVMQLIVKAFAWLMLRTMGTSGAESLNAAGNIFLGQTEAPLLVKPFVRTMTNSELHSVMTGGFATIAGGVLAAFVGMLAAFFPNIAGHLIAASVMSAPAALAISKIMYPETEEPVTRGKVQIELEKVDANAIDAAARGASEGLHLALNVAAMLLAFIALLALANGVLGWVGGLVGFAGLSIQMLLGWIGAPLAWLMGTPWKDAVAVGVLIGEKTALNEFVAYLHLAEMLQSGTELSARSVVIATYALCGFANFSSIAIQIGGIGGLAPERRGDLSRLGMRAMIAGTLASFMTACVVGILL
jgi:CNT family concentrative nucleoside transporter